MMRNSDASINFLYGTAPGRLILKAIMVLRLDRLAAAFLRSPLSRGYMRSYASKKGIIPAEELKSFRTYREFFLRDKGSLSFDMEPSHLISPCDGLLSAFRITDDSVFCIKDSFYRLSDLLEDAALAEEYRGGDCLIFRLRPSDYHHYFYIDDCFQHENHYMPGLLHSVQPVALENHKVYTQNRRSWCVMETAGFGPVIQTEVGALIVGGIVNHNETGKFPRGAEKGHFDLAGSTIVLLFQKDRIRLRSGIFNIPDTPSGTAGDSIFAEYPVKAGMHIGYKLSQTDVNLPLKT